METPIIPFPLGDCLFPMGDYVFDVSDWVENRKTAWPVPEQDKQWFALLAEAMDHVRARSGDVISPYVQCVEHDMGMALVESREDAAKRYLRLPALMKQQFRDKSELVSDLFYAAWHAKEGYPPGFVQLDNLHEDILLLAGIVNIYRHEEHRDAYCELYTHLRPEDRDALYNSLCGMSERALAGVQAVEQAYDGDEILDFMDRWYREGDFLSPEHDVYQRSQAEYWTLVRSPIAYHTAIQWDASIPRETAYRDLERLNNEYIEPLYDQMEAVLKKHALARMARIYCADDYSTFHSDALETPAAVLRKFREPYKENKDINPSLDDRIGRQEILAQVLRQMREVCGESGVSLAHAALRVNAIQRGEEVAPYAPDLCRQDTSSREWSR